MAPAAVTALFATLVAEPGDKSVGLESDIYTGAYVLVRPSVPGRTINESSMLSITDHKYHLAKTNPSVALTSQ